MNGSDALFRLSGGAARSAAVDAWLNGRTGPLGEIARKWFGVMRNCGDEVLELMHDGCPTACLGDAAFGYVNVFQAHVNVGFFQGATLRDPAGLLQGTGKRMRHVKLKPGEAVYEAALAALIREAYADMKARVENG